MKTVNSTGRVMNPYRQYAIAVKQAVAKYESKKEWKKNNPRGFKGIWKLAKCSMCKRGMRKDIAVLQIENKRENAPICMACIMGYKRKDPKDAGMSKWKTKTIKKFIKITNQSQN